MLIKCVFDGSENECSGIWVFSAPVLSSHPTLLLTQKSSSFIEFTLHSPFPLYEHRNNHSEFIHKHTSNSNCVSCLCGSVRFFCILYPSSWHLRTHSILYKNHSRSGESERTGELKPFPFDSHAYLRICTLRIYFRYGNRIEWYFPQFSSCCSLPHTYMDAIPCSFNRFAFAHQRIGSSLNFQHFQIYAF